MPGGPHDLAKLAAEIAERDERDSQRALDPLKPADDALVIDSSNLTAEQVVERMKEAVERWRSKG